MKKTTTPKASKTKTQDTQLEEMMKSQIYLYQFCNTISQKNAELELKLQNAYAKISILEKNDENLKKILELINDKLKDLKEQLRDDGGDGHESHDDENDDEDVSGSFSIKNPPMHDDVTLNCEVCNKIFHARLTKCPNCGYNRFEKDR